MCVGVCVGVCIGVCVSVCVCQCVCARAGVDVCVGALSSLLNHCKLKDNNLTLEL